MTSRFQFMKHGILCKYRNTAICRILGNCICLGISTEAQHTRPGKWQKGRSKGDAIHSLPAVVVSLAQGVGMLSKTDLAETWIQLSILRKGKGSGSLFLHSWYCCGGCFFLPEIPLDKGNGHSMWIACEAGVTAVCRRKEQLHTNYPLAQTELWVCMVRLSDHSCHTTW